MSEEREQQLWPLPERGRVFEGRASAGLGDVSPAGRARLDTIARWLQDVAFDDVRDAELAETGLWVIRKARLVVQRFPLLREEVTLQTFCSGIGPRWAERRTVVRGAGAGGAVVDAVALWVHLDPQTGAPSRLVERYAELYEEASCGRVARGRLRHPAPGEQATRDPWFFRRADLDPADHVNNAAYWAVVEEHLGEPDAVDAEIEHRDAAQPGEALVRRSGDLTWIAAPDGETLHASIRL